MVTVQVATIALISVFVMAFIGIGIYICSLKKEYTEPVEQKNIDIPISCDIKDIKIICK